MVVQWRSQNGINFTHTQKKTLKHMPRLASKIGATLKRKNLLPEGANSFL